MRRVLVVCSVVCVLLTFLLVLTPAAGAAMPPEGAWSWASPYQPATALAAFQLTAVGPVGSVYVAGDSYASGPGPLVASRVGADGTQIWSKTTLGPGGGGVAPWAVTTDAKRNLFVAGGCGANQGDVYVAKLRASDGTFLWQRHWDGKAHGDDIARSVVVDKSGNVYVAGYSETANGMNDAIVQKYDAGGHRKWTYALSTSKFDFFFACGLDGSGNLYVTGESNVTGDTGRFVTLKLSPSGGRVWQRTISGLGVSYGGRFLRVRGTSVTVVGGLWTNGWRPVILRYTLSGKRTWATVGSGVNEVADVTVDAKGRVYVVGTMMASPTPEMTGLVGFLRVWEPGASWPGTSTMFYSDFAGAVQKPAGFNKVAVDGSGRIYCAGMIELSALSYESDAVVVLYPPVGAPSWTGATGMWRYSGPGSGLESFYGLVRASDDDIYAAGQRAGSSGAEAILHKIDVGAGS